jgi:hypothetical protein
LRTSGTKWSTKSPSRCTPRAGRTHPLYRRDKSSGDAGLTGLTGPIGYFTCASLTRRAYDVPASATVAER